MKKEYTVSDLFYTKWSDLQPDTQAQVYGLAQSIKTLEIDSLAYGHTLIATLRLLRKRPLLVDKITVAQAVDIYNDLTFLNEMWYFFPHIKGYKTPDEKMARSSFDQFIYADNEFTSYLATQDDKHLARLAATLYPKDDDTHFDPETVEHRATYLSKMKLPLMLIFFTYSHVREFIVNRCKHLLPKGEATGEITPSGPMWYSIKHQASRTLVFGTFETLGQANMYSVLDHLELLSKENSEKHAHA